ncbi:DNA topoisomerase 2 [Hanseniaspora osmophila]|uniref:DNA topoisomerase 2 n=1 Tax=Hanseniaspora osmophila TaxID=56408 RepID=A0A1E5RN99_9ASCO|nr:DNA topoisomerase 2 [Hanseniaspora osmophila]
MSSPTKSSSDKYQKISQLEHILKRPDTYVGSVEMQEEKQWIFDEDTECMIEKEVKFVPGLFKIFDEILVNAADNKVRDASMKKIEVTIDAEKNEISVKNDGSGIPIEIHNKEKIYIPEMIFGHLLTSSNYNDDEKKVVGGRNGYGAKLCNIFSTEFVLETADPSKKKKYIQKWENNMQTCNPPTIVSYNLKSSYTKITFKPDLKRFHMDVLDKDILGIMNRRVYDINGSVRDINVSLNGKSIKIRNFKSYVELYLKSLEKWKRIQKGDTNMDNLETPTIIYERFNDRWEVAFAVSDVSFQQVSFVNSIATTTGGTHINYICDQIIKKIQGKLKKKNVKPFQIKNNIFLFINCLIENPAFTSQTKEQMTTRVKDFGSKCEISDEYITKIMKTNLSDRIFEIADENADKALKKTDGVKKHRITEYPKLEDANKAGTREGWKCTLILTEGDSALTRAVAGLAVVGRDYYGCYPLRGKMLNVRDASSDQINKNQEIQAIKKIMGLQHKKRYEDVKTLRYGHLMIMADQDYDGSHIKGLLINFLETSFPGLLEIPGFLIEFITPIIKVSITKPRKQTLQFFNIPEYSKWRDEESSRYTWSYKYYKGLGTSGEQEMREYFSNLDLHLKTFHSLQDDEDEVIELAFSKKKADARKEWLRQYEPGTHLDHSLSEIPIKEFINKELILFSLADNIRSIPNVMDGLKPVQRKVIYGSFKHNVFKDTKVSTLAQYISAATEYHHGDAALQQTVVGLAQDFVGTNNIYLLIPKGAFGSRSTGGKDAAASRYIYTHLNKLSSEIFNTKDQPLLKYMQEDDKTVEPEWYAPVLPMLLVNGSEGIGTGWSTNIPSFNPLDIIQNIYRMMDGKEMEGMTPWFRGWTGTLEKIDAVRYKTFGRIEQIGPTTIEITELPPKVWTINIKEHLLQGIGGTEKVKPWIKDMEEQHGSTIKFVITLTPEEFEKTRKIGFYERFKLVSSINLSNMVAFDHNNKIKKYDDPRDILEEFFYVRLEFYLKRKDYMIANIKKVIEKLEYQIKFIQMIISGELKISNKPKKQLSAELHERGFPRINKKGDIIMVKEEEEDDDEDDEDEDNNTTNVATGGLDMPDAESQNISASNVIKNGFAEKYGTYDYLLSMKLWSLTMEKYNKLMANIQDLKKELDTLLNKTPTDLWKEDLVNFEKAYHTFIAYDNDVRNSIIPNKATGTKKKKKVTATSKKVKKETSPTFDRILLQPAKTPMKSATKIKKESSSDDLSGSKGQKEPGKKNLNSKIKKELSPSAPPTSTTTPISSNSTTPIDTTKAVKEEPNSINLSNAGSKSADILSSDSDADSELDVLKNFNSKFNKVSSKFDMAISSDEEEEEEEKTSENKVNKRSSESVSDDDTPAAKTADENDDGDDDEEKDFALALKKRKLNNSNGATKTYSKRPTRSTRPQRYTFSDEDSGASEQSENGLSGGDDDDDEEEGDGGDDDYDQQDGDESFVPE